MPPVLASSSAFLRRNVEPFVTHDNDTMNGPPEPTFGSIKGFAASFVSHLHTRLQLFATEVAEERLKLTSLLFGAVWALFFTFMTLVLAALFVIAAYWDTPYRLHAVALLILLFMSGAGISWSMLRATLKSRRPLFEASLAELYKDKQQLNSP